MNSFHRSHGWVRRLQGTAETKPAWFQPGPAADVRCVDFPAWHHHAAEFRKLLRARKSLRYIGVVYHDYSDPRRVFTISSWRAPHAVHASSICPRSLPPSQRWHLLKDQQQCEFGEALRWKAAEIRGNAWSTLQVEAQVFQHQNVSPNSFNIETPTKTHLAPVFWTTVLLTRPQIPQTTELCWWRVDMAHGHTCFIRQRSLSWHVGWWSTAMSMWQQL